MNVCYMIGYIYTSISVLFLWYEGAQIYIVTTSATLPFLSQSAPTTSWWVPYNQLTEEKKNSGLAWNHSSQIGTWTHVPGLKPNQNPVWDSNPPSFN